MSESDGEASFESADEGGESPDSQAGAPTFPSTKESQKLDADVSTITEKTSAMSTSDRPPITTSDVKDGGAEKPQEPTPTRKAQRVTEKEVESVGDVKKSENLVDKGAESAKPKNWGWGNISNWGSNVLTTASSSVQTFAGSVGEGFQTVLDTVESSLGAPDPELVAQEKREKEEKEEAKKKVQASDSSSESGGPDTPVSDCSTPEVPPPPIQNQPTSQEQTQVVDQVEGAPSDGAAQAEGQEPGGGWFGAWGIGGITTAVGATVKKTMKDTGHAFQETGKTIVEGSLDVLETIGKKTYDVLAEGDHGLKKTIKKTKDKPNLSQLLREAKEQAAEQAKQEEEFAETRKAHYGAQFDDFQGLVQLEALEMLSNQSEGRVQGLLGTLKGPQLELIKKDLVAMKDIFELKDMEEEEEEDDDKDHDFDRLMADYVGQVGLNITPEKLIQVQEKTRKWLMDCREELDDGTQKEPKELHQQAIQSLAEFTARSIELFHRVGQLILMEKNAPASSYKTKATSLASATRVLCTEIGISSSKFTQYLGKVANSIDNPVSVNPLITNVFLEASNSSTYIQDAFLLLLPVLQQGAIEAQQRQALLS